MGRAAGSGVLKEHPFPTVHRLQAELNRLLS